jgi:transcriptional regulator with XRE-family HTH domain
VLHCASGNPADILAGMASRTNFRHGRKSKGDEMTDIENPNIRIGERLRLARKNAGLLQETAAQHLGVARPTLVAIEKGQRPIRRSELRDLAALYRVSQDWISSDPIQDTTIPPLLVNPEIIRAVRQIEKAREDTAAARFAEKKAYRDLYEAVKKCLPRDEE